MATPAEKPTILLGSGMGFAQSAFEGRYNILRQPSEDLEGFARVHGDEVRVVVASGARPLPPPIRDLPNLGLVAIIGSGYEGLGVEGLRARGVQVTHSPNANAPDVADHAIALLLAVLRKIPENDRRVREGRWVDPSMITGLRSVRKLRIGVLGMGAIGQAIARRMAAFDCAVSWWGPNPKPELAFPRSAGLLELARDSDVLFAAHRADESNRGLIDVQVIEALGPGGMLVNVARGSAVDEDALISALRNGTLGGAGLDVFSGEPVKDSRWADVPNTVLTPHIGGAGDASWAAMLDLVHENLARFFRGEPLATPVPGSA